MRVISTAACLLAALAVAPAVSAADPIHLAIHDGRVSLEASDATIGQILTEWARVGHTRIVNGERVPGGRVTLQLTNVPEREALDILLRTAAGYIAAARSVAATDGSQFDRILILPTTTAPPPSIAASRASQPAPLYPQPYQTPPVLGVPRGAVPIPVPAPAYLPPGVQRAVGSDGQPIPDDQDDAPPQPYVPLPPGFSEPSTPAPAPAVPAKPGPTPSAPVGVPVPGMIPPPPKPTTSGPQEVQPTVVHTQP